MASFIAIKDNISHIDGIFNGLQEAFPNAEATGIHLQTSLDEPRSDISKQAVKGIKDNAKIKEILEVLKTRPTVHIKELRMSVDQYSLNFSLDGKFPLLGNLTITPPPSVGVTALAKVLDCFAKFLALQDSKQIDTLTQTRNDAEFVRYQETILGELRGQIATLGISVAKQSESMAKFLQDQTTALEAKFSGKEKELRENFEEKEKKLKADRDRFEKEKAGFDARDRTVVRRDILERMRKIIQDRTKIELSKETQGKRTLVHISFLCALLPALALAGFGAKHVFSSTAEISWTEFLPLSSGIIAFVSFLIYYIRWNNDWFAEHAEAELANKQFEADILRASWLAELYFEWDEAKQGNMPAELITTLSRNLFEDRSGPSSKSGHPLEELLKVAGRTSKIGVKPGEVTIESQPTK